MSLGTSYIGEGGPLITKLHPGSYAAIIAGLLRMVSRSPERIKWNCGLTRDWLVYTFLVGMTFCGLYVLCITGTGNVVVFADTFFPAGMLALALTDVTQQQVQTIRALVRSLLMLSASVALVETVFQSHVVPVPKQGNDFAGEFRPTGLYDHALTGAAATMLGLWLPVDYRSSSLRRWLYSGIALSALVAFGERSSLGATLSVMLLYSLRRVGAKMLTRTVWAVDPISCVAVLTFIFALYAVLENGDIGTRLGSHLYWDTSAQVRLSQFGVLSLLTPDEITFGCSRQDILAVIEALRLSAHVGVIENFWLFTFVTLGLIAFPIFLMSFVALLWWLWRMSTLPGRVMVITFVGVTSLSNSLGRKSTLLITLVACVIATSSKVVTGSDGSLHNRKS